MIVGSSSFVPLHLEVQCTSARLAELTQQLKDWKEPLRQGTLLQGGIEGLLQMLRTLEGVEDVQLEGAQSAGLIPVRLCHALTGQDAHFCGVLGTGPIAQQIEGGLTSWGLQHTWRRLTQADSPLEISLRAEDGAHTSVKLYPGKRALYRFSFQLPAPAQDVSVLFVSQVNQGTLQAMQSVSPHGPTILRVHRLGRSYGGKDPAIQAIEALPFASALVLSTRGDVLRKLARKLQHKIPRGFSLQQHKQETIALAQQLHHHGPDLVVLTCYETGCTLFSNAADHHFCEPPHKADGTAYDNASRAARIQGALGAAFLQHTTTTPKTLGPQVMQDAWQGTEQRPWRYG